MHLISYLIWLLVWPPLRSKALFDFKIFFNAWFQKFTTNEMKLLHQWTWLFWRSNVKYIRSNWQWLVFCSRRKAGKRLKFGETLAAGERSRLEEVDEDEEAKENVGRCRNISAENLGDKSNSAVQIAEHITETANKGKVTTVSTDAEQESDPRAILSMASAILDGVCCA